MSIRFENYDKHGVCLAREITQNRHKEHSNGSIFVYMWYIK